MKNKQMRGRGCQPLLHVAVKFGARRIDRVAGMHKSGIRAEPTDEIVDRFITPHGLSQCRTGLGRSRHLGELALIGLLEGDAVGIGAIEIALDRHIVEPGVEIGEIPLG